MFGATWRVTDRWSSHLAFVKPPDCGTGFSHTPGVFTNAERVLQEVFGLDSFRPGQADVVAATLAGRDVLSVAPTGSGKSISYLVPAVVEGGLTVVVSRRSGLMKEQV